jgi:hypothetical protein
MCSAVIAITNPDTTAGDAPVPCRASIASLTNYYASISYVRDHICG